MYNYLIDRIKKLYTYERRIFYYGPFDKNALLASIDKLHRVPETLQPVIPAKKFEQHITRENTVLFVPYDANQINFAMVSNRGEKFDPNLIPIVRLYNTYFGGGMSSIVFQEMREARGLAYSAWARLFEPSRLDQAYTFQSFIATQNDKMDEAAQAFLELINYMPESENAFDIAKESIITNLRTQRVTRAGVIWNYIDAQEMGLNYDRSKIIFENVQDMTLEDVKRFQEEHIKNRMYTFCILGRERDLDFRAMANYGRIRKLSLADIFGY